MLPMYALFFESVACPVSSFLLKNISVLQAELSVRKSFNKSRGGNKELISRLVVGSFLALMLGMVIGTPILVQNLALGEPPEVYAEVVYAYFGLQPFNQNVSGLFGRQVISYLFVLNVTNLSDQLVIVNNFVASAAESMWFLNATSDHSFNATEPAGNGIPWNNSTQVRYMAKGGVGLSSKNGIASRSENIPEGNQYYWSANTSRLVALTGIVEVSGLALQALRAGKIFVFSNVGGKVYGSRLSISGAYVIKGIELQNIQNQEFVYNVLLKPNQSLHITGDGIGVVIVSES